LGLWIFQRQIASLVKSIQAFLLLSLFAVTSFFPLQAQHTHLWSRFTLASQFTSKIQMQNEFQFRRQNGYERLNFLEFPLMNSYRIWLNYKHDKQWRFSFSPLMYSMNYAVIANERNLIHYNEEIRFAAAAEYSWQLNKDFLFFSRNGLEYRIFPQLSANALRIRNRVGFKFELNSKSGISLSEEFLWNSINQADFHFFDQNRVNLIYDISFTKIVKIETGYMWILKPNKQ
jgi:hypothetical protein